MTLEIIVGGAGTGKTRRCLESLLKAVSGGRAREVLFILFNNQQVQAVREYLHEKLDAFIEPHLLTFHGLIKEILIRSLLPPPRIVPDSIAMHLFRKAAEESDLSYYRAASQGSLLTLLKNNVIDELKVNGVTPDALHDAMKQALGKARSKETFSQKAGDVCSIYRRYQQLLQQYGYEQWPDAAYRAAQVLTSDASLLEEKKLLLMDGFFYVIPWQKSMLRALFRRVPHSMVTICYDHERPELFRGLHELYSFLTSFPAHRVARLTENMRAKLPSLKHVEKNLFSPQPPQIAADESVSIYVAASQQVEAELIARAIKRMVIEEGYLYSDFCVVLRYDTNYRDAFMRAFQKLKVPLVSSRYLPFKDIPSVRAVMSLLQMVTNGWHRGTIIAFLRGVASIKKEESDYSYPDQLVDFLENRALALGINNKEGWLREFGHTSQYFPGGSEGCGGDTVEIIRELSRFEEKLSGLHSPESLITTVSEVIDELGILKAKSAQESKPISQGSFSPAKSYQFDIRAEAEGNQKLSDLLRQFLEIKRMEGAQTTGVSDLLQFITDSAETLTLELPPENPNGVLLANVFDTRVPEFKVVFIAGLLEGCFPPSLNEDPIFRDRERRLLNGTGKTCLQERLANAEREKYLFYIALTRASEKIVLSYPYLDFSGKEELVSSYVDEFRGLFTDESIKGRTIRKDYSQILPQPNEIISDAELMGCVIHGLYGKHISGQLCSPREIASLYNLALDRNRNGLREVFTSMGEERRLPLRHNKIRTILQAKKHYSVSEIHTFGLCKFKYYCRYLLGLEPREEHGADLIMEGEIFHEALRRLYQKGANTQGMNCEAFLNSGLDEIEAVLAEKCPRFILSVRGENFKARMMFTFKQFLEREYYYQQPGPTCPAYLELSFGLKEDEGNCDPNSKKEPLRLVSREGEEFLLRGRIDRVDILEREGKSLGIVLDYKRGRGGINLKTISSGEDIRLPLYMLAVERLLGIEPAGGLYYSLRQSSKRGFYLSEIQPHLGGKEWGLSHADASSPEDVSRVLSLAEVIALERLKGIRNGEINVEPLSEEECRRCDYNSVCRYEGKMKTAISIGEN